MCCENVLILLNLRKYLFKEIIMINFLLESVSEPSENTGASWWVYLILLGLVLVMLIVPSISNKKRAKEYNEMIDAIGVGDTIRTVGGIIGRIVKINEKDGYKTFILETGAKNSKTTMEFDMASIYTVINSKNKPAVQEKSEPAKVETQTVEEVESTNLENKNEEVESTDAEPIKEQKPRTKKSKKQA